MCVAFGDAKLLLRFEQSAFPRFTIGTKLARRLSFLAQSLDRFVLREFRMANLGLQVAYNALGLLQRAFGFFPRRGFGGQSGFCTLEPTAGRGGWRGHTAMGRRFVTLIAAEDRHWDIAILDEAAAM
jgi:hypothetical protein